MPWGTSFLGFGPSPLPEATRAKKGVKPSTPCPGVLGAFSGATQPCSGGHPGKRRTTTPCPGVGRSPLSEANPGVLGCHPALLRRPPGQGDTQQPRAVGLPGNFNFIMLIR